MAVWETDDESPGPRGSLPTPADTPYRTPSRNVSRSSRKSRRSVTPPGKSGKSSSPPPLPRDRSEKGSKRSSKDITHDETISILDPRRFTPTLHANLVSEILALRRDQEEKLKIIESLETSLHASREETEALQETLVDTTKESRSLKRQLALLEGGTSSALGELARERDDAVESVTETRRRLEASQKKLRSQEEDSERVHHQWAKEKDEWEEEKRKYERRVHVAETRLKAVLDEVAAYQAAQAAGIQDGPESEVEESAKENDAASVRTMSMTNSIRFSVINGANQNGHSLADELGGFDDGYDDESDYGGRQSVLSNGGHAGHMRNMSRDSLLTRSHMRRQSNDSLMRSGSVARRLHLNHSALGMLEDGVIKEDDENYDSQVPAPKPEYVDTGIQFSPPPSPKIVPVKPSTPEPNLISRLYDIDSPPRDPEIEANQRRKRVHIGQPLTIKPPAVGSLMVNGSSQTVEEPLSPPKTPKSPVQELPPTPKPECPIMVTSSTQTDIPPPLQPSFVLPPMPPIPSISIIPPTSRPTTPREPRLPQLTKDFGCQVSILASVPYQSASVQTEEIRVDKRVLDKLPAHLHPSAITSRPNSPAMTPVETFSEDSRQFTPIPGNVPPRNPRRLATKRSLTDIPSSPPVIPASLVHEDTHDAYPGNNDDGPLSNQKAPMRRPHRISSLFAGFDGGSSDEIDEFLEADMSDSEYRTALSAPRPSKAGTSRAAKRGSGGTGASVELPSHRMSGGRYSSRVLDEPEGFGSANVYQSREVRETGFGRSGSKRGARSSMLGSKSSGMRKAAMIQSGIASHQRARSPSLTDPREPPFPIPTRASSRKPPVSASAPSDGRSSPTTAGSGWHRRGSSRSHYRSNSIRKVRSAAALPRNQRYRRHASRSPPPFSASTEAPESPGLPPLPSNDITTPRNRDSYTYSKYKTHQPQLSTNTANTAETGVNSLGSSNQATGVVDAIAQTMVGEWMFKYVRRRKSFGVADGKGGDDSSNDRHKRWVWLAPYERAILWSSKQPVSGSALMGKAGRKLTIQSVLDVKDDNPPPKGVSGPVFNRSILILTPQRALKFTAVNAERHYIWLTSLSFLAHSSQAVPESLVAPPPPKPPPEPYELPKTKVRRNGIRDSIRLTKSKAPVIKSDPISAASSQIDSVPPSIPSYRQPALPDLPEPYTLPTHARDLSRDAAEPPFIPRFTDRANQTLVHGRKRSNTGGHVPPPLSFRGFSGPAGSYHHAATNSTAGNSVGTAGSSDIYSNGGASSGMGSSGVTWATGSVRTSEASSRPSGPVMNNFFDAIGTVRMEAFISPLAFSRFEETPYEQDEFRRVARRRSKEMRRRASRSRQRDSYQSKGTRGTDDLDEWFLRDDPFRGF
ncbi:hypothetical protein OQA88_10501 [Cercophora sp. LCS_1]